MENRSGFGGLASLFSTLTVLGFASISPVSGADSLPTITVRVYNYARVKAAILADAEREATRIFAAAGLETTWLECPLDAAEFERRPACQQSMGGADIVLRIVPQSMEKAFPLDHTKVGFAFISKEGRGGILAVVFHRRVRQCARGEEWAESLAIGRAAVHEIGHLLLRTEVHSSRGIMRGDWHGRDFRDATAILNFMPEQAEHLRTEVRERQAQLPAPAGHPNAKEPALTAVRE